MCLWVHAQSPLGILKWLQSCVALGFCRTYPGGTLVPRGLALVGGTKGSDQWAKLGLAVERV